MCCTRTRPCKWTVTALEGWFTWVVCVSKARLLDFFVWYIERTSMQGMSILLNYPFVCRSNPCDIFPALLNDQLYKGPMQLDAHDSPHMPFFESAHVKNTRRKSNTSLSLDLVYKKDWTIPDRYYSQNLSE